MEDGNPAPETNVIEGQPEVLYVQGAGNQGMVGQYPQTQAVVALVLSILGLVMCGLCTAIPGIIMAGSALKVTKQHPGHPDHGIAQAANIVGWITAVIWTLIILFYVFIFVIAIAAEGA
tara:strand:- start:133 stop:489 length:357 start_codon:yes stop_codon:yes gene_type:complete